MSETPELREGQDFVAPDESKRIEDVVMAHDMAKASNEAHSNAATERRFRANAERVGVTLEQTISADSIKKEATYEETAELKELKAGWRRTELEAIDAMSLSDLVARIDALRKKEGDLWEEQGRFQNTVRWHGENKHLAIPVYSEETTNILDGIHKSLLRVQTMLQVDEEKIKEYKRFPNIIKTAFRSIFPTSRS